MVFEAFSLDTIFSEMVWHSWGLPVGKTNNKKAFLSSCISQEEVCNFDISNQKSPCHFESCFEDPEAPTCIRYILEYCSHWEDRGCTIELPQLLNKVDNYTMEQITTMKSPYLHVN